MSSPGIPSELIDAIIDQVALLSNTTTLSSCALASRAFVFPSQKHIFHTINLDTRSPRGIYYLRFHRLLLSNPYLGTHVRHLRLVDDSEDDFAHGFSWMMHLRTPINRTLGFLPNLRSFSLSFNSTRASWNDVPVQTREAFCRVFRMESLKELELEFVFQFPMTLLMSLARLRNLALSNMDLAIDDGESNSTPPCLEGLYLRGVSPAVIKTLTKTLSNSPPTLRKLALTPTFEMGFTEAVAELITACGSHLTSFAWFPSLHFPSSLGTINISTLHHLRSLHFMLSFRKLSGHKPFAHALALLLQLSNENTLEKISFECHFITRNSQKSLAKLWRPLDSALSEPTFQKLKEVEIILAASSIPQADIEWFMEGKVGILSSVEARGVMLTVRVERGGEERELLERLRQI